MPQRAIHHRRYWSLFLMAWLVVALFINFYIRDINRELRQHEISSLVYVASRNVLIDAVDVETGLRGFLLTERRDYLEPYYRGVSLIHNDSVRLSDLTGYDGVAHQHARQIRVEVSNIVKEASNQIEICDTVGIDEARDRFVKFPIKSSMDNLRKNVEFIQIRENRKINDNIGGLRAKMSATIHILDFFSAIVVLVFIAMLSGFLPVPAEDRWAVASEPIS